jgi:branched-chain amino acid transport system ATP-binding protein
VHTFYGDSHGLHGVSFSLQSADVLALPGRNEAGKTTCISTIIGFLSLIRHGVVSPIGVEGRSRLLPQRMPLRFSGAIASPHPPVGVDTFFQSRH